jgi:alpha-glucoside transport system substrate-binding protein
MKAIFWRTVLLIAALAMVLAACGPAAAPATEAPAVPVAPPADSQVPVTAPAGSELARALAGEFKGTTVTMSGPFTDADAIKFEESVKRFEQQTGIKIQYSGSKEFEAEIAIRIEGGNAPDIVDFPQPGFLATFVKDGYVVDLNTFMNAGDLATRYNQSWLDMATMDGPSGPVMAGIWARVNGKSLVWYPKPAWDEAGYDRTGPRGTNWIALSDQIVSDGDSPWCIGIESGAATGWPATDWMEEIHAAHHLAGELRPLGSRWRIALRPRLRCATLLEKMGEIWFNEGYVLRRTGQAIVTTTSFGDAPKPMFEDPPGCWLHKQGNFITTFFPEGKQYGSGLRLLLPAWHRSRLTASPSWWRAT